MDWRALKSCNDDWAHITARVSVWLVAAGLASRGGRRSIAKRAEGATLMSSSSEEQVTCLPVEKN